MNTTPDEPPDAPAGPIVLEFEGGGRLTVPNKEAAREAVAHREAQETRERARRDLWGDGPAAERMVRLCQSFPTLTRVPGAGVGPWDPNAVLAYACSPVSHGERLAALFVLRVWNASTDWNEVAHLPGDDGQPPLLEPTETLKPLDLFEAWAVWDFAHQQAALAWLAAPFWP